MQQRNTGVCVHVFGLLASLVTLIARDLYELYLNAQNVNVNCLCIKTWSCSLGLVCRLCALVLDTSLPIMMALNKGGILYSGVDTRQ